MAKNKKPRKKYHPKPRRMLCFDEEQRASVRAMVDRFELVAEIALPRGTADFEDNVVHALSSAPCVDRRSVTGVDQGRGQDGWDYHY